MITTYLVALILPAILVLLFTPVVIRFANWAGAVDSPGHRKVHTVTTPRLGGLAVVLSLIIALPILYLLFPTVFEGVGEYRLRIALVGTALMSIFLLGIRDDLTSLRPGFKFAVQFAAAGLVYMAGFKISNITHPFGGDILYLGIFDLPLTLIWLVGITNAFNLIDGLDGLATGVATIACISIFSLSVLSGDTWTALLILLLIGSLIGFLRYNFNPAKIFLGDSGSLFVGFALALISIHSTTKITTGFTVLFPMLVLILPITDTLISMVRRLLGSYLSSNGEETEGSFVRRLYGMFVPDRSHIHHQLLSLGLSHRNVVLTLYGVSAFFSTGALLFTQVENPEQSLAITIVFGFFLFIGIKNLRYYEIAIFNNGLMLPFYEWWIVNRPLFQSLIDLCFIGASFALSYYLIQISVPGFGEMVEPNGMLMLFLATQFSVFWLAGLYREKIDKMGIGNALGITAKVAYASGASALLLMMFESIPLTVLIPFLVLNFYLLLTFILGFRISYQALSFWFNRDKKSGVQVLIYGANENGTTLLHKLNNSRDNGYKVIGFLDDSPEMEGKQFYGYPVLGGHWKFAKLLERQKVDSIFICDEDIKPENLKRLKRIAKANEVDLKWLNIHLQKVVDEIHEPEKPASVKTRRAVSPV